MAPSAKTYYWKDSQGCALTAASRRALTTASLLSLLGLSILGCSHIIRLETPERRTSCKSFQLDIEEFWTAKEKREVKIGGVNLANNIGADVSKRIITKMDAATRDWVMMQERLCYDVENNRIDPATYRKRSTCLDLALISQRTFVEVLSSPSKDSLIKADEILFRIQHDVTNCHNENLSASLDAQGDPAAIRSRKELAKSEIYSALGSSTKAHNAAEIAYEEAAKAKEVQLIIEALINKSALQQGSGKYKDALRTARLALSQAETENYKPGVAKATAVIGMASGELGAYDASIEASKKALSLYTEVFGAKSPKRVVQMARLAGAYGERRDFKNENKWLHKALVLQESLDNDNPIEVVLYNNIGSTYRALENYDQALAWLGKGLRRAQDTLGEHNYTVYIMVNLGRTYSSMEDYKSAIRWLVKALKIQQGNPSLFSDDIGLTYRAIAHAKFAAKDYDGALEWTTIALKNSRKTYGSHHPRTVSLVHDMGAIYMRQEKYDDAIEWYESLLNLYAQDRGSLYVIKARALLDVGYLYEQKKMRQKALRSYREALRISDNALGEGNSQSLRIIEFIENLCDSGYRKACNR